MDIGFAALEQDGAEGDAGVVVAVEPEVADGPGVGAAFAFLEFVEDLHGADLRGAGDGAGGEGGAHHIERTAAAGEFPGDMRDDVHDMAVALDGHEVGDFHGAVFGDAADIVAGEVDEHEVLGAFLGVGHEVFGVRGILFGRGAAPAGACDGADFHEAAGEAHMDFRRTADERVAAGAAQAEHVGRGVDEAQGAVEAEGVAAESGFEPLGEHDLENVAGADVFLRALDHGVVFAAGGVRCGGRGRRGGVGEQGLEGEGLAEFFEGFADALRGSVVGGAGVATVRENIFHDAQAAAPVVEDEDGFRDHEEHVRNAEFVLGRRGDGGLEPADAIVAEVADGAAVEGRHGGVAGGAVGRHPLLEFIKGVAGGFERARGAVFGNRKGFARCGECGVGAEAEEGIAAGLVVLLGGFEQEGRCGAAEFRKGGDGRLGIRHDVAGDLQHASCARLRGEGVAGRGEGDHGNETLGASRSAGFSMRNCSAGPNWKMPATMLAGKTSRCVL